MDLVREVCDGMTAEGMPHPTLFEMETALGFWYFREKECDIVVLETGMGGLLDATNVVEDTCAAVLTSISMDHMKFLGGTLTEIAAQKAGILKKGVPVVYDRSCLKASAIVEEKARELGCRTYPVSEQDFRVLGRHGGYTEIASC